MPLRDLPADWATIRADFGDGTYAFRLDWTQLLELEKQRQCGPLVLLNRLAGAPWSMEDVRETLRLALIGGGLEPGKALRLVRTYCERRPILETLDIAYKVLAVAVNGPPLEHINGEVPASAPEQVGN